MKCQQTKVQCRKYLATELVMKWEGLINLKLNFLITLLCYISFSFWLPTVLQTVITSSLINNSHNLKVLSHISHCSANVIMTDAGKRRLTAVIKHYCVQSFFSASVFTYFVKVSFESKINKQTINCLLKPLKLDRLVLRLVCLQKQAKISGE